MIQTRSFAQDPDSVVAARRFAGELLQGSDPGFLDAVELMVSELATNAIKHTESGFELTIATSSEEIRVQATDHGAGEPTIRPAKPADLNGRGLQIIDMLATSWGYELHPGSGKTVWFALSIRPAGS